MRFIRGMHYSSAAIGPEPIRRIRIDTRDGARAPGAPHTALTTDNPR